MNIWSIPDWLEREVREREQMIANISALQAVFESARSGGIERVES